MPNDTDIDLVNQVINTLKENPELRKKFLDILLPDDIAKKDDIRELLDEIKQLRIDFNSRSKIVDQRFDKTDERLDKIDLRFDKIDLRFDKMDNNLEIMHIGIMRIENKEGPALENAILKVMKETLALENIIPDKIRKEFIIDETGIVFYKGFSTDIDILVENGNIYLIEVKATISSQDIAHFLQKKKLYEEINKVKVSKLILISLRANSTNYALAESKKIKIIAGSIIDY